MAAGEEAIATLKSIDATLKAMLAIMRQRTPKTVDVATDRDLDSKYGDPKVTMNPRDWTGESCKGLLMSECPPDFLDLYASALDYFAQKAEETGETYNNKPTAPRKRQDAARARGWAKRIREGKHAPPPVIAEGWEPREDGWS